MYKYYIQYKSIFSLWFREIVSTPDGDQFSMHWVNDIPQSDTSTPIVVFYPGLCSSTTTKYVRLLTKRISEENFHCVTICNRGLEIPCLVSESILKYNFLSSKIYSDNLKPDYSDTSSEYAQLIYP